MRRLVVAATVALVGSPCCAAGNGAGAGGAGHQRAINSGLPAGEAGPPGSPNNPRPRRQDTSNAPAQSGAAPR